MRNSPPGMSRMASVDPWLMRMKPALCPSAAESQAGSRVGVQQVFRDGISSDMRAKKLATALADWERTARQWHRGENSKEWCGVTLFLSARVVVVGPEGNGCVGAHPSMRRFAGGTVRSAARRHTGAGREGSAYRQTMALRNASNRDWSKDGLRSCAGSLSTQSSSGLRTLS